MTTTEVETGRPLGELAKALSAAQGKIEGATKNKENPHFKSKFADLASIWSACRKQLAEHGLAVVQEPLSDTTGNVGLATTLLHSSGQSMRSELWVKPQQAGPQALGSCISYLKRYALAAVVGVATEDDDGEGAEGRTEGKGNGATKPPVARANTVKHDGAKASQAQIAKLHMLRAEVGGLVVCDKASPCPYPNGKRCGYHTQLAAFKEKDGKPVTSSKDLSPEQISNLIDRYEKKIAEQAKRAADVPDIGAVMPKMPNEAAFAALDEMELIEYVLSPWGVDKVSELSLEDQVKASLLAVAYTKGAEAYSKQLRALGFGADEREPGLEG
jgi:hypothetical protein